MSAGAGRGGAASWLSSAPRPDERVSQTCKRGTDTFLRKCKQMLKIQPDHLGHLEISTLGHLRINLQTQENTDH